MPFYTIPKNASEFKTAFSYIKSGGRKKVIDLMVEVNRKFETDPSSLDLKGSFLYYGNLVFIRSVKRGSGYYFYPTDTLKKPLRDGNITKELLDDILAVSHQRRAPIDDGIYWEFLSKPGEIWTSALSQAYALELFSHDKDYWPVCNRILKTFDTDWLEGGVFDKKMEWYLEYPMIINQEVNDIRRVMNGHIDALLMLYRYYKLTGNKFALKLFRRGNGALIKRLPSLVSQDGISYYSYWQATNSDTRIRDASYNVRYHHLHVTQLYRLFTITKNPIYKDTVKRMMKQPNPTPYYLTPYTVDIIESRVPNLCCPKCKDFGSCDDCLIKNDENTDGFLNAEEWSF